MDIFQKVKLINFLLIVCRIIYGYVFNLSSFLNDFRINNFH
nr:MAG TPA: hypothetical protein [Caudoviricetes sp.]